MKMWGKLLFLLNSYYNIINMRKFIVFFMLMVSASLFAEPSEIDYNHAENTPLYFGNPSDAITDIEYADNYLMEKDEYTLSYNNFLLIPNWVGWHLCSSDFGDADRSNKFAPDTTLPKEWYAVKKADYQFAAYGFDRGHVCPSADRTTSKESNEVTFLMTNMIPQSPDCNRIIWKELEEYERKLALEGNELYIFAGPFGSGGTGNRGYFTQIDLDNNLAIRVPEFCWKVILAIPEGTDDLQRIKDAPEIAQMICVFIPNCQDLQMTGGWEQFECELDYIEEITHLDFFELME